MWSDLDKRQMCSLWILLTKKEANVSGRVLGSQGAGSWKVELQWSKIINCFPKCFVKYWFMPNSTLSLKNYYVRSGMTLHFGTGEILHLWTAWECPIINAWSIFSVIRDITVLEINGFTKSM